MSDSRLQHLKRAWEASGRAEDEAAYLFERVRTGGLSRRLLELAARCGHEGSRFAIGQPSVIRDLQKVVELFDPPLCLVVCIAIVQEAAATQEDSDPGVFAQVVTSAEACLNDPTEGNAAAALRSANQTGRFGWAYDCGKAAQAFALKSADACSYWTKLCSINAVQHVGEARVRRAIIGVLLRGE